MHNITLKVPEFVANYDDWSDDELLFMAFMHWCVNQNSIYTQFYMYAQDASILLGQYNSGRGNWHNRLFKVRRIFEVGKLNTYTITFNYYDELLNHIEDIQTIEVEITDPMVIARWSYLVGRLGKRKDMFEEHNNTMFYKPIQSTQSAWWRQIKIPFVEHD